MITNLENNFLSNISDIISGNTGCGIPPLKDILNIYTL